MHMGAAGRALLQTVPGTNILKADTSTRQVACRVCTWCAGRELPPAPSIIAGIRPTCTCVGPKLGIAVVRRFNTPSRSNVTEASLITPPLHHPRSSQLYTYRTSGGASTLRSGGVGNANMQLATQAAIRRGSTATPLPAVAATRNAARANAATRTAIGSNAAQSAVRTAVRTNNAAGGTRAGAGIAEATVHGAGKTVTGAGTRAGLAGMSTQSAVQVGDVRGQVEGGQGAGAF